MDHPDLPCCFLFFIVALVIFLLTKKTSKQVDSNDGGSKSTSGGCFSLIGIVIGSFILFVIAFLIYANVTYSLLN